MNARFAKRWWVVAVALVLGAPAFADSELPATIDVNGVQLQLNGKAVQRKLVFEVYRVALYLEHPTHEAKEAVGSDQAKQIHLTMLHDATRKDLIGAMRNGMVKSGVNIKPLRGRLNRLFAAMPDLKRGEDLVITYSPGKGTTFQAKSGERLSFTGKDFADGVFSIWLGSDPAVAGIKKGLVGG